MALRAAIIVLLIFAAAPCIAEMVMSAEEGRLNASARASIAAALNHVFSSIIPNATYTAGHSFHASTLNDTVLLRLHFYEQTFCDPSFVDSLPSASGSAIAKGFAAPLRQTLALLASHGYGSTITIHGQYQLGYTTTGTRLVAPGTNCTRLTATYNNTLDYCFAYQSLLHSHTPWRFLYPGCRLRSTNHRYYIEMQNDCNLVLTNGDANVVLWASNTYLAGRSCYLALQEDMNLVIYDGTNRPVWASNTQNTSLGPTELVMQNDGFAVLYKNDGAAKNSSIWGTFTWNGP